MEKVGLGVAGVCALPFANTAGEKTQEPKVCVEHPPVSLWEFAPGPVHSQYRIWNAPDAATLPDLMLFLSPMALINSVSLTVEISVSLSAALSFVP